LRERGRDAHTLATRFSGEEGSAQGEPQDETEAPQ
jgi:hypothetical protein